MGIKLAGGNEDFTQSCTTHIGLLGKHFVYLFMLIYTRVSFRKLLVFNKCFRICQTLKIGNTYKRKLRMYVKYILSDFIYRYLIHLKIKCYTTIYTYSFQCSHEIFVGNETTSFKLSCDQLKLPSFRREC